MLWGPGTFGGGDDLLAGRLLPKLQQSFFVFIFSLLSSHWLSVYLWLE